MKKLSYLTLLLVGAAALTACSSGPGEQPADASQPVEIQLMGSLTGLTRAFPTQSTSLLTGQTVYAWVDDAGNGSEHVAAWTLQSQADGRLLGANKYYFPASGNTVNVYAVHGNFAAAPQEGTTTWDAFTADCRHSVMAGQGTEDGYAASDLLFARNTAIVRDNTAKLLTFSHLLSKIEITLLPGDGVTAADLAGATVTILNTRLEADVTLSKDGEPSVAVVATAAPTAVAALMDGFHAEAIVVPQTVTGVQLLMVSLPSNGRDLYTSASGYTFDGGKKYSYNVTVNAKDLEMSQQITDWTSGGTAEDVDVY